MSNNNEKKEGKLIIKTIKKLKKKLKIKSEHDSCINRMLNAHYRPYITRYTFNP